MRLQFRANASAWLAAGVFCVASGPWLLEPRTLHHDCAWYVYAAGRMLDGARLYVDLVEPNPPLVYYLTLPSVAFASSVGWAATSVFNLFVLLVGVGSILLASVVLVSLVRAQGSSIRHLLVAALSYFLILFPRADFGQREHLLVLFVLPYVLLTAARVTGAPVKRWIGAAIGVIAGLGLLLKPHFLLAPAALQLYALVRTRRLAPLLQPENVALALLGAAYGVHFVLLPSDVQTGLRTTLAWVLGSYGAYDVPVGLILEHRSFWSLLLFGAFAFVPRIGELRGACIVSWIAGMSFLAGAMLQQKGWPYHFLPARTFCGVVGALAALGFVEQGWRRRPRIRRALLGSIALLGCAFVSVEAWKERSSRRERASQVHDAALLRDLAAGGPIAALDTSLWPYFPLVNYADLEWSLRFPFLWPLPGILRERAPSGDAGPPVRGGAPRSERERLLLEALVEDMERRPPTLVLVKRGRLFGVADRDVDILEWFLADERFAEIWRSYAKVAEFPGIALYRRR